MNKKISKYQYGVALGRINYQGGCLTEMGAQAMGLYPGKYGPELPIDEEPVGANIYANRFSIKGG